MLDRVTIEGNKIAGDVSPANVEHFDFEKDFVEQNIRCIPMIVRFKMDAAGIKLKLAEWARFTFSEKEALAENECVTNAQVAEYRRYLQELVRRHTGGLASDMEVDKEPEWANVAMVAPLVLGRAAELGCEIAVWQWRTLTALQRFALLKLARPGHESRNFAKALSEFKLLS
jgi:hypothetical protein